MNAMSGNSTNSLDSFFKAFAHPARLVILEELRKGEQCVCHLEARLSARQSYVSQQLAVLRDAGLITDRRDGWNVYYSVKDPRVFDLLDATYALTGKTPEPLPPITDCCCPRCKVDETSDSHCLPSM